jgi:hypothetical protein
VNPIQALTAIAGSWRGTNTLQDPITGKPEESPSTVTVTSVLGGRLVRVDYTWGYQDKLREGSLLVGFDPSSGEVSGHWVDTWHMGRKGMAYLGSAPDGTISVKGPYAAPPGPDWGWRIDIATDPLRITHSNIDPDGKEELAAEGVYSRGVFFKATGPIGDADTNAWLVKEIGPAVVYYTRCLGFSQLAKEVSTAKLRRNDVEIGLAVNGRNPEQASCWLSVGDVDALWREFDAKGIGPGIIGQQEYGGKPYRVFFAKDCYGVFFCIQPLDRTGGA